MLTLAEQLRHKPFPEVAQAIRDRTDRILERWHVLVLEALPHIDQKTIEQFEDDVREILFLAADSLECDDEQGVTALFEKAPAHGLDRFLQRYDLTDMLTEHRILRSVIGIELEDALGRCIEALEAASIHAIIDVMFQQGTLMMVRKQQEQLREAAEAELKFLSYFSHDISNNLLVISASLDVLDKRLLETEQFEEECDLLETARRTIKHTTDGMRRLLNHERLRRSDEASAITDVNLHEKLSKIAHFFAEQAKAKGMRLIVDADPDATIATDPDLLYIMLQNIAGNAVKHACSGEVRLSARREEAIGRERWRLSVTDLGPGIERDQLEKIFDAFKRGDALGADGVGLGLAIASQAAKLLKADIEVDTQTDGPNRGTTFHIILQGALVTTA